MVLSLVPAGRGGPEWVWGHIPHLVLHPAAVWDEGMSHGLWPMVYVAAHHEVLNASAADPGHLQLGEGDIHQGWHQGRQYRRCCGRLRTRTASRRAAAMT